MEVRNSENARRAVRQFRLVGRVLLRAEQRLDILFAAALRSYAGNAESQKQQSRND